MKTRFCLLLAFLCSLLPPRLPAAGAELVTVIDRGPHSTVVQTVLPDGTTNHYTQLQTGLNRWSETDEQYVPASDEVELVNGLPLARKTQYQATFGATLDASVGAVDVLMPDGKRFRARPAGIAYTEFKSGQPGKSVFVAETKASAADLSGRSEVSYPDALSGVAAAVRYRVSLSGLEQDIVLGGALPQPGDFQMDEKLVRVEVWNEILESPPPEVQASDIVRADGSVDRDEQLAFAAMLLGPGNAIDGVGKSIRVARQWQTISGKVFLIESIPYFELKPFLAALPAQAAASRIDPDKLEALSAGSGSSGRLRPVSLAMISSARQKGYREVASGKAGAPGRAPALIWDWVLLANATNFTFKGDTTWYVSGPVTLSVTGTNATVIEGSAVVKFTNSSSAQITISGPVACQTIAYRPAVFTSKDSNALGEKITGSTGSPSGFYGYGLYLYNSATLHDLRFLYANTAITLPGQRNLTLQDSQFISCFNAILGANYGAFNLENDLFDNLDTVLSCQQSNTLNGVNLTVHNCNWLGSSTDTSNSGALTNCLLANVTFFTLWLAVDESFNANLFSDFGVFQTVGAGRHYLQSVSPFRDAGAVNISPALLARLSKKTTYPPAVLTTNFTANTTLAPLVPRDDDGRPDFGFHYDVLDYAWSGLALNNATLTLTNGVAAGMYGTSGTSLQSGARYISEGNAINLNHLARYQSVQEGPLAWGTTNATTASGTLMQMTSAVPDVELRFSDVSLLAGGGSLLGGLGVYNVINPLTIANSQVQGLNLAGIYAYSPGMVITLTNNWIERCPFSFYQEDIPGYYPITLYFYNNLFHGGTYTFNDVSGQYTFIVFDNLFDADSVSGMSVFAGWNGFRTGLGDPLGGSGNVHCGHR